MLFSTYGSVLDVVALKTMKMRGQAHIVFRDVQSATQAMRALEGQTFLGRQLVGLQHANDNWPQLIRSLQLRKSSMPRRNQTMWLSWTVPLSSQI